MKFKRKDSTNKKIKKSKSKRISLKAMEQWNKIAFKKSNTNKFKRKPPSHKLYIQCESTGGAIANQNLREQMQEITERINNQTKRKEPILELLPEKTSKDKYL